MDIFCMVLSVLTAVCSLIVAYCVRRTRARWEDAVRTWKTMYEAEHADNAALQRTITNLRASIGYNEARERAASASPAPGPTPRQRRLSDVRGDPVGNPQNQGIIMAVSPQECLSLNSAELRLVVQYERVLDNWLRDRYEGVRVSRRIPKTIKGRALRELATRYQSKGWQIQELMRDGARQWFFQQRVLTPEEQAAAAAASQPEQNRTRLIDLTSHLSPASDPVQETSPATS